jgi:8-oxo-dGTP pyrophosphatase MutT (NUDIX family)
MQDCEVLATGPWWAGDIRVTWRLDPWQPAADIESTIAAAWHALAARPGVHLFDGPMARLQAWQCISGVLHLGLQPTGYRAFIGTNGRMPGPGDDDAHANPLGTSSVVETADGWLLLGRRSPAVALHPGRVHPFGGSHEPGDGDDVLGAVARELREELSLPAVPIALALVREPELRQPELLCVARSALDAATIAAGLDAHEHDGLWRCRCTDVPLHDPQLTPVARATLDAWLRLRRSLDAAPS